MGTSHNSQQKSSQQRSDTPEEELFSPGCQSISKCSLVQILYVQRQSSFSCYYIKYGQIRDVSLLFKISNWFSAGAVIVHVVPFLSTILMILSCNKQFPAVFATTFWCPYPYYMYMLHSDSTNALLWLKHCNAGVFTGMSKAQFRYYTLRSTQINKLI